MIARIIDAEGADNLTAKKVRILLEDQLGLKGGALKAYKDDISQNIDEVLAGKVASDCGSHNEEDDDQVLDEGAVDYAPKAKKARHESAQGASGDSTNKGKATCITHSGAEAPKVRASSRSIRWEYAFWSNWKAHGANAQNVKKMQEAMKMTRRAFLQTASTLEVTIDGNTLRGQPRSFSSGAMGWYLGGKCEMNIGAQQVWAQVGLNIVIPGSGAWRN